MSHRSDALGALAVAILGAAFYVSLRAINYDPNGIATAQAVEFPILAWPNHMFFEFVGYLAMQVGALLGYSGPSYGLLQVFAGIFGGLALGCAYLLARKLGADRLCSYTAVLWLAGTWAFWTWSTNVAYISFATFLVAMAFLLSLQRGSGVVPIATGVIAALSVLTWQANVFVIPFLLVVGFMESESLRDWQQWSLRMLAGFAMILIPVYLWIAYISQHRKLDALLVLFTTHGGIDNASTPWGHWGWDRPGSLAQTWLLSTIGAVRGWAAYALGAFALGPLLYSAFKPADRDSRLCLAGLAAYLPFVIWWDPYETKWLLIPNLFFAILAARAWSQWGARWHWSVSLPALAAAAFIFWSNLSVYAVPAHTQMSEGTLLGDCVGAKLQPSDLYIQSDWVFGGYMSYKYRIELIDLISQAQVMNFDRAAMVKFFRERVETKRQAGAAVYTVDPSSVSPDSFKNLLALGKIKSDELESLLPGRIAFTCRNWNFRRLESD
jgi:hypothetical protein